MTPLDLTQCPPPEGMEWIGRVAGLSFEYEARRTSSVWVNLRGDATQDEDPRGWYVTVTAFYLNLSVTTGAFLPDLPAAYRRALQAVGLASPWTSEVPTEGDLYLVRYPSGWIQLTSHIMSGAWLPASGRIKGLNKFPPGTLFMPCPQPPKETPHG